MPLSNGRCRLLNGFQLLDALNSAIASVNLLDTVHRVV